VALKRRWGAERAETRLRLLVAALVALVVPGVALSKDPVGVAEQASQADGVGPASLEAGLTNELIPIGSWQAPPHGMRPLARWWWPGGAVDEQVLRDQLGRIESAGFGAVEVQPLLLGLGAADLAEDPRLRTVGEPSFTKSIASAASHASELGVAFDLTLGSGWPGGLPTAKQNAERQLLMSGVDVEGPVRFAGPLPAPPDQSYRRAVEWVLDVLGPPDPEVRLVAVLAARLGAERAGVPTLAEVRVITESALAGRLDWAVPAGRWRILAFYENATEHFVMGGAFPGEEADARVVDHLSRRGADALLEGYASPILDSLAPGQVREVFVDSFELMGELPFTSELLEAFEARAGYSLLPHLPLLFRRGGESKYAEMMDVFGRGGGPIYLAAQPGLAARVREDYETVRAALFEERFVERFRHWARRRGVALRLQAHGGYGDYLDIYARADVPESEALFGGGRFDFLKLASSAAHVAGHRWASSESFITLRLFGTHLSDEEMRLLAGRAFSAGINRLAYHGVPYPYTRADGVPWYPFSGGFGRILAGPLPMSSRFDDEQLAALPAFNRFVARMTLAMSRGRPRADVAWLRADPIYPDSASLQVRRIQARDGESSTTKALRARGLVYDRVSRRMLTGARVMGEGVQIGAARYGAILLDPMKVAEPELLEAIASVAEAGLPVLLLGPLPERAPGLRDARARDQRVQLAVERIEARALRVPDPAELEPLLEQHVRSTLVEPPPGSRLEVSIDRRQSEAGDTLLVFNESWSKRTARLRFTRAGGVLTRWDPRGGRQQRLRDGLDAGDVVELELEAAEILILTLEAAQHDRNGLRATVPGTGPQRGVDAGALRRSSGD
jgi:hypothetical protein